MSRIQLYIESIRYTCPECKKESIEQTTRPYKCSNCGAKLSDYKYIEAVQ